MKTFTFNKEDLEGINVFFTSDLHLNHFNICKLCNRPYESRSEMNNSLIDNWNSVIYENDIIFILGDFCFDQRSQWVKFLEKLKGRKYLIIGNHDKINSIPVEYFQDIMEMAQLWIYNEVSEKHDKFFLCHYPVLSYPGMFNGFYQLYGHVHTRENNTGADANMLKHLLRSYDVGVDNNNFAPISHQEVITILNQN